MPFHLDFAPLAGFVALMAVAAFEDFRRLVIPNGVVIGLCVLWPFQLAAAPGASLITGMAAIGCGFAVFFAGALLFSRGLIGGGDVKLLAAATLWAGPGGTLPLLLLTGLLGTGCWVCSRYCRFAPISPGCVGGPRRARAKL